MTPGRTNLRFQFRRHFDQRYNKTNSDCHHRSIVSLISLSCGNIARVPSALGQYSRNFGKLDSLLTSMPVTICIISDEFMSVGRAWLHVWLATTKNWRMTMLLSMEWIACCQCWARNACCINFCRLLQQFPRVYFLCTSLTWGNTVKVWPAEHKSKVECCVLLHYTTVGSIIKEFVALVSG